ncbi:MAG: hypothetical protein ACUVR8_10225 [Acidobacteriota bacterium]
MIALRVWEKMMPPLITRGSFYGVELGRFDRLDLTLKQSHIQRLQADTGRLAMVLTIAFFALYHLYLYFSLYVYQGRSSQREYLWLSLFAGSYALTSLSLSNLAEQRLFISL